MTSNTSTATGDLPTTPQRRISVALLAGDSAHVLRPMLASLVAQTRAADEVVVHDGGSSDGTLDLIRSFDALLPISVIRSAQRRTVGASRAAAIDASTGELIAIADHDDAFLPDHLAVLEAHVPGPGTVATSTALLWTPGVRIAPMSTEWDIALPPTDGQLAALAGRNVITGMSMYTRADYERFGPYRDESFAEDWDLWLRMALGGVRFVRPDLPTLLYRWGHANVSSNRGQVRAAESVVIERYEAAMRSALGSVAYDAAMKQRAARLGWDESFERLRANDGAGARRIARQHLRSGDRRLLATALLPSPIVRRFLRLPASS
jgi:glycosyltransferase involved in cell wall biosynthesis